jgi:hypothetical protein
MWDTGGRHQEAYAAHDQNPHRTSYLYGEPVVLRSHRLMLRPWESRDLRLLSSGIGLGRVGQQLANISSDFDPRTYSYRKLSDR